MVTALLVPRVATELVTGDQLNAGSRLVFVSSPNADGVLLSHRMMTCELAHRVPSVGAGKSMRGALQVVHRARTRQDGGIIKNHGLHRGF